MRAAMADRAAAPRAAYSASHERNASNNVKTFPRSRTPSALLSISCTTFLSSSKVSGGFFSVVSLVCCALTARRLKHSTQTSPELISKFRKTIPPGIAPHHFFLVAAHLHPAPQKGLPTEPVILVGDSIAPVKV